MLGNIYTSQKCPKCSGSLVHDPRRRGCFCRSHDEIRASGGFYVSYKGVVRRCRDNYAKAEQILNGFRFKESEGSFDKRDYHRSQPLGFANQADKWLSYKERCGLRKSTTDNFRREVYRMVRAWGNTNVKNIGAGQIEDFLLFDHLTTDGHPISSKTRHNLKSTLSQIFRWISRREGIQMPEFPDIGFKLGWRRTVDIETQQEIIAEVKQLSFHHNPKIWLAVKLLATYPKVRPGELIRVLEGDIRLDLGLIHVRDNKEGAGKNVYLHDDDIELVSSFPRALPEIKFFRHHRVRPGIGRAGEPFGPTLLNQWWRRACRNVGVEGVGLYGGTKHSTVTALGSVLSPEQIRRGGTGHRTNAAFNRYLAPRREESARVTEAVKRLQNASRSGDCEVVGLPRKNAAYAARE